MAEEFAAVAAGLPDKRWTHAEILDEGRHRIVDLVKKMDKDPKENGGPQPLKRALKPQIPPDFSPAQWKGCIDVQDDVADLYKPGEFSEIRFDGGASDYRACWMPGTHQEWAFRIPGKKLPVKAQTGHWKIYAVVRVEKNPGGKADSTAFEAGVYDIAEKKAKAGCHPQIKETGDDYRSYLIGTVETNPDRDIWVAPAGNEGVKALYVDRVFLMPAK